MIKTTSFVLTHIVQARFELRILTIADSIIQLYDRCVISVTNYLGGKFLFQNYSMTVERIFLSQKLNIILREYWIHWAYVVLHQIYRPIMFTAWVLLRNGATEYQIQYIIIFINNTEDARLRKTSNH